MIERGVGRVGRGKKRKENREINKVEIDRMGKRNKRMNTYMNEAMILSDREK